MSAYRFTVHGRPQTAGSKRSFAIRRAGQFTGRVATTDDNPRVKSWQAQVALAAVNTGAPCTQAPVRLALTFYLHRPRAHHRTGRNAHLVRDTAPAWHSKRPDVLKLARAVEDALTGVLWHDDAQICDEHLSKRYTEAGEPERVDIRVEVLSDALPALLIPGQLELAP